MKIRTRFLLFLLPTLIGSIALVSTLLAYNWYTEIEEAFKSRLNSAVVTTAKLIRPDELKKLESLQEELLVDKLYFVPAHEEKVSVSGMMTAMAPFYDHSGSLLGHIAADVNTSLIKEKFHESLFLIALFSGITILIMVATLFIIANKISRPIQKLNKKALALAAGQYGESIASNGPKEIVELAGTLNIMSECLLENINRLKENAIVRERMYGEYECAMLLQHLMLQKNIQDCRSDAIAVKPITFFSENPKGILLDFPKAPKGQFLIEMTEAFEDGFEGMYQLLTASKKVGTVNVLLDLEKQTLHTQGIEKFLIWSMTKKRFLENGSVKVQSGDLFFLFNQGVLQFYKSQKNIELLLTKVLKVFAQEGLETISAMLQKEISFLVKKKDPQEDLHLLCFQLLNYTNYHK